MAHYSEESTLFDGAGLFLAGGQPSMTSEHSTISRNVLCEEELIRAARAELRRQQREEPVSKEEAEKVTDVVVGGGDGQSFAQRLGHLMKNVEPPPTIEIEYSGLTVEADALVGSGANPSVWNSVLSFFKSVALQGGLATKPVAVLDDVSGVLKPGRLTLLLGPPGAGKSLLMQVLSGRLLPSSRLRITGDIRYNGVDVKEIGGKQLRRTAGLVDQYDYHIPILTVQETVDFAMNCQGDMERYARSLAKLDQAVAQMEKSKRHSRRLAAAEEGGAEPKDPRAPAGEDFDAEFAAAMREVLTKKLQGDVTIRLLGLSHVANTVAGSEMLRGLSGGERKRLTTAEIMAGQQFAIMMDEISTGLDSATTYSITQTLLDIAHSLQRTIVVSLLQPPPEVFHLFDDVLLMTDGRVIYHGPVKEILPFFQGLGFVMPGRKDPASFLQEVTTPAGQLAYATPELLARRDAGAEQREASPSSEMLMSVPSIADAFWQTKWGTAMRDQLANKPYDKALGHEHALAKKAFGYSWAKLTWLVLKRQFTLALRDRAYAIARLVQVTIVALVVGSLFSGIGVNAADGRTVLAFMTVTTMVLCMMSQSQVGLVFQTKRVFYKQRDNAFFPASSYVIGLLITQVPQMAVESCVFCVIAYWIVGLTASPANFFIYLFTAFSASTCLAALFRLLAFASPSMVLANASGGLGLLLLTLSNGFSIIRTSIPSYIIWIYYGFNPLAWGIRALAVNELTSSRWDVNANGKPLGDQVLLSFGFFTDRMWIWTGIAFMWGWLVLYSFLGALALSFTNPPTPQPTVSDDTKAAHQGRKPSLQKAALPSASQIPTADAASLPPPVGSEETIPFVPITLVCRDVRYFVDNPAGNSASSGSDSTDPEVAGKLELLKGLSVYAEPGSLTALMGGSGAGKTTFMDVIAGRKTQGIIRGDILVNGFPKVQASWSRVVGYVEQTDLFSPSITVQETLLFSSRLRLAESISMADVEKIVAATLETIELTAVKGTVVGELGSGLSIEQRKRLSIGVELVASPSVVFMDEPTSGLDARAAAVVMRAIRNVADSNRTVMVTIHQPSMEIFEAFDNLVLLQRGGRLTYFGPLGTDSSALISYLEAVPGVDPIRPGYNPATWMLEVTGGSMTTLFKSAGQDFPVVYQESQLRLANEARMDALAAAGSTAEQPLSVAGKYATSLQTQRWWLLRKFFKLYWHSPSYNFVRLFMTLAVALVYGITYLNQGKLDPKGVEIGTVQNVMGLIFSMAIFLGMFNCMTVQPIMGQERAVYYRERAASMYSPMPYALATAAAEIPYLAGQAIIMVTVSYWLVGFQASAWKFFYTLLLYFLSISMYTFMGQLFVFATPNQLMAQLMAAFLNQMTIFFSGFLVPYPSIPTAWKWANRVAPTSYIIQGLTCVQLCDSNIPLTTGTSATTTISAFMDTYFGLTYGMIWWCVLIILGFCLFFRVLATILLATVNFNRR